MLSLVSHRPICARCHRPILVPMTAHPRDCSTGRGLTAYLVHDFYGCDTGCCGHKTYLLDLSGAIVASAFTFAHPSGGPWREREAFIRDTIQATWSDVRIDYARCDVVVE